MRGTRGTETSKYPEEEKSNEILRVVASESGRGQTDCSNVVGVRTGMCSTEFRRTAWEGRPEDVRVMYPKNEVRYRYPEYLRTRGIRREDGGTTLQA